LPSPRLASVETAEKDFVVERDFPYVDEAAPEAQRGAQDGWSRRFFQLARWQGRAARDILNVFPAPGAPGPPGRVRKQRCNAAVQAGFLTGSAGPTFAPPVHRKPSAHHPARAGAPRVHPFVGVVDMIAHYRRKRLLPAHRASPDGGWQAALGMIR